MGRVDRMRKAKDPNFIDPRLQPLEQNLQDLGAPKTGVVTLKVARKEGRTHTAAIIQHTVQVKSHRFYADSVLDLIRVPKYGSSSIRIIIVNGKIDNIKILEETRGVDVTDITRSTIGGIM